MVDVKKLTNTLIINRSESRCGVCGGPADPHEARHERPMGYQQKPGCGAEYDSVTTHYAGLDLTRLRPDLPRLVL